MDSKDKRKLPKDKNENGDKEKPQEGSLLGEFSSDESLSNHLALSKGEESTNIYKAGPSRQRPVSPPPSRYNTTTTMVVKKHREEDDDDDDDDSEVPKTTVPKKTNKTNSEDFSDFLFPENLSDDDDENFEDSDHVITNPSGSVLVPAENPYNKQEKIRQANIDLFKDEIKETNETKIQFDDHVCLLESKVPSSTSLSINQAVTVIADLLSEIPLSDHYDKHEKIQQANTDLLKEDKKENRKPKLKFDEKTISGSEETSTSTDSSETETETENGSNEVRGTELPGDVKVKGMNTKVLLIMVPNANISKDSVNVQSDNSSSENEDVCVGNSRLLESNEIEKKEYENIERTADPVKEAKEKEKEEDEKDHSHEDCVKLTLEDNFPSPGGDYLPEINFDVNKNSLVNKLDERCITDAGGYISAEPENNTGIKIKITCPDCTDILDCDKSCRSNNNPDASDTVSLEKCVHSTSASNRDLINQCLSSSSKMKNYNRVQSKNSSNIKNTVNNISINLNVINSPSRFYKNRNLSKKIESSSKVKNTTTIKKKFSSDSNNIPDPILKEQKLRNNKQIKNQEFNLQFINCIKENSKIQIKRTNVNKTSLKSLERLSSSSIKKCNVLKKDTDACDHKENSRPKSCVEIRSKQPHPRRPVTAPVRRGCCNFDQTRLPDYNGYRSEYGLSEEQLQERKRLKFEKMKQRKIKREEKIAEEEKKRKENEEIFLTWLAKKNELAKKKKLQTQMYPLCTFRRYSSPTTHLLKVNSLLRKPSPKNFGRSLSIDKLLNGATPQEKRTYRIYLGLGSD